MTEEENNILIKKIETQEPDSPINPSIRQNHQSKPSLNPVQKEKSLKNSASLGSGNNLGSQTLTDAAVTTVIRKQTESGGSDLCNNVFKTERTLSHQATSSVGNKFSYLMTRGKKLSQ